MYIKEDKKYENDVKAMKQKINELVAEIGPHAPWIERLDLVNISSGLIRFSENLASFAMLGNKTCLSD